MSNNITYYERFKKETIYLWEDEAEVYIKSTPTEGYFAKYPGNKEFNIGASTEIVNRAIDAKKEVSKNEYDKA
jgi:hypothetical protein